MWSALRRTESPSVAIDQISPYVGAPCGELQAKGQGVHGRSVEERIRRMGSGVQSNWERHGGSGGDGVAQPGTCSILQCDQTSRGPRHATRVNL